MGAAMSVGERETDRRDGHRGADVDVPIVVAPSAAAPGTASGLISTLPRKRVAFFWPGNPHDEVR